jgi:ATP synthase subunit 6
MYFCYSPFEQFNILNLFSMKITNFLKIYISNVTLYIYILFLIILYSFFVLCIYKSWLIPKIWQYFFEEFFLFTKILVYSNIGTQFGYFIPIIFTLFTIISVADIIGIIPYAYCITSQIILTLTISTLHFIWYNIIGILKQKFTFFELFLPPGVPLLLVPFLIMIELISYIARLFSLAIRLFANMMAGHILLKLLSVFIIFLVLSLSGWIILNNIPLILLYIFYILEIAIAFLQAYVFTILICIYSNDMVSAHKH